MKRLITLLKIEGSLGLRCPDSLIFGIGMPVGVLLLIGMVAGEQTVDGTEYTFIQGAFAALMTVGICATAFMGLPLTLANYRDKKILKHFFVTPVSPMLLLFVQVCLCIFISLLSAGIVSTCSVIVFGYHMEGHIFLFIVAFVLVLVSMYSIGMVIASLCPNVKIANVVCTFVYFPMLFLSGATIPYEIFPKVVQNIAHVLPLTHGVKLLKNVSLGIYNDQMIYSVIFLLVVTVIGCIISIKMFRWE